MDVSFSLFPKDNLRPRSAQSTCVPLSRRPGHSALPSVTACSSPPPRTSCPPGHCPTRRPPKFFLGPHRPGKEALVRHSHGLLPAGPPDPGHYPGEAKTPPQTNLRRNVASAASLLGKTATVSYQGAQVWKERNGAATTQSRGAFPPHAQGMTRAKP